MLCAGRGAKRNCEFRMGPVGGRAIRPAACGTALCPTRLAAATATISVNRRRSRRPPPPTPPTPTPTPTLLPQPPRRRRHRAFLAPPWTLASMRADTRAVTIGVCSIVSLGALLLLCCLGHKCSRKAASRERSKTSPAHAEPAASAPRATLSSTRRLKNKRQEVSAVKLLSTAPSKRSDACVHADDAPGIALSSIALAEGTDQSSSRPEGTDQSSSRPEQADEAPAPRGRGGLILLPPKAKQPGRATTSGAADAPLGQSAGEGVLAGAAGTPLPRGLEHPSRSIWIWTSDARFKAHWRTRMAASASASAWKMTTPAIKL